MKIHEGKCSSDTVCTRTHGYKCRACTTWFKQFPIEIGKSQLAPSPFYPYCSYACAQASEMGDKGFHLFAGWLSGVLDSEHYQTLYPDATAHHDFNRLMMEAKEL